MERSKILDELAALLQSIQDYECILKSKARIDEIIIGEFEEIKKLYGDPRLTEIVDAEIEIEDEDLIAEEYCMVVRTHQNYIKRMPLSEYQAQKRGGQGKIGMGTKDDDYVRDMFVASSHQRILIFTSLGRVFLIKVYELPQGTRTTKGRPIINMLPKLEAGESVETILPLPQDDIHGYIIMATQNGIIKKTECMAFKNVRKNGLKAIQFREGDKLIGAALTDEGDTVMLVSANGYSVRFDPDKLRAQGRVSMGVRGIRLREGDKVASMEIIHDPESVILTVTENGFGKRTPISEYPVKGRGGLGIRAISTSERNGKLVAALVVADDEHLLLATNGGKIIRTRISEIRIQGRATAGVKLMNTQEGENIVAVATCAESNDDDAELTALPIDDSPEEVEDVEEVEEVEDDLTDDDLADDDLNDEDVDDDSE